jgi:menaquinone-dependent protoporphyrinogen oxidase
MERVGTRGHIILGGRLSPDAKGFPASAMAKT